MDLGRLAFGLIVFYAGFIWLIWRVYIDCKSRESSFIDELKSRDAVTVYIVMLVITFAMVVCYFDRDVYIIGEDHETYHFNPYCDRIDVLSNKREELYIQLNECKDSVGKVKIKNEIERIEDMMVDSDYLMAFSLESGYYTETYYKALIDGLRECQKCKHHK